MLKFIPHAVFEVPHSIPHWGTPAFHPTPFKNVIMWLFVFLPLFPYLSLAMFLTCFLRFWEYERTCFLKKEDV